MDLQNNTGITRSNVRFKLRFSACLSYLAVTSPTCIFHCRAAKAHVVLLQYDRHSKIYLRSAVLVLLLANVAQGQQNATYSADGMSYVMSHDWTVK